MKVGLGGDEIKSEMRRRDESRFRGGRDKVRDEKAR